MKNVHEAFPLFVAGGLIILSVGIVILGHKQGDANAAAAATATAIAPTRTPTIAPTVTRTPTP